MIGSGPPGPGAKKPVIGACGNAPPARPRIAGEAGPFQLVPAKGASGRSERRTTSGCGVTGPCKGLRASRQPAGAARKAASSETRAWLAPPSKGPSIWSRAKAAPENRIAAAPTPAKGLLSNAPTSIAGAFNWGSAMFATARTLLRAAASRNMVNGPSIHEEAALLPLREKVGAAGGRMRGRAASKDEEGPPDRVERPLIRPASQATFSRWGRRGRGR